MSWGFEMPIATGRRKQSSVSDPRIRMGSRVAGPALPSQRGSLRGGRRQDREVHAGRRRDAVNGRAGDDRHRAASRRRSPDASVCDCPDGTLFVTPVPPSNSCQEKNRTLESPGQKPCRELATRAGIWRYDAKQTGQAFSPRERYATGLRNPWRWRSTHADGALYAAVHGRDQLSDNWPKLYTVSKTTELPAEIFARIDQRAPTSDGPTATSTACRPSTCSHPNTGEMAERRWATAAPEGRPDVAFPAHWAPDAIAFYTGPAFPNVPGRDVRVVSRLLEP